jgi:hypothetical protein
MPLFKAVGKISAVAPAVVRRTCRLSLKAGERRIVHALVPVADPSPTVGMRKNRPRLRRFLIAAVVGASVVGLLRLSRVVLEPLHQRGVAQPVLGPLIALCRILQLPGQFIQWDVIDRVPYVVGVSNRYPRAAYYGASFAFYAVFVVSLGTINRVANRWADRPGPQAAGGSGDRSSEPESKVGLARPSRRRVLIAAKTVFVGGAVVAGGYPLFVETRRLSVTRRLFSVRGLPDPLDGLRVVQLTDIHLGPWTSVADVRRMVAAANALDPDLIALTGDYVLHSADYVAPVAAALAGLRARVGVVGVLGNHDWWEEGPLSKRALANAGVRMVDNGRVFVTPGRRLSESPREGLCVAGVGDLMTDEQHYDLALGGLPADMPRLLLSHNPDVAEERPFVASGHRVDLMLSGHTHGGQIRLPLIGSPVTMSRYGQKYARGLVQGPTCPVYVSRGLGMAMLPVRLGSVPEIAVIELRRA